MHSTVVMETMGEIKHFLNGTSAIQCQKIV